MLNITNLTKIFQKKIPTGRKFKDFFSPNIEQFYALDDISFQVTQGEKLAFIGPNGSGKSTTIKCILGILHYNSGNIDIFGHNPLQDRVKISRLVSSVFGQRSQLLYNLPLIDSFDFFKIIYDIPNDLYKTRLNVFCEKFGINDFLNTPVRKLSLGQRMKGEIIASLLHGPKAIFLDEPTVGLDIVAKKVMYEILLDMNKEENLTIFLTSHDLKDVETLCNRVIIINSGKLIYDGLLYNLLKKYGNSKIILYKEYGSIDYKKLEIQNDSTLLEQTIKDLFKNFKIEDIKIEGIPLEEIIQQFYK